MKVKIINSAFGLRIIVSEIAKKTELSGDRDWWQDVIEDPNFIAARWNDGMLFTSTRDFTKWQVEHTNYRPELGEPKHTEYSKSESDSLVQELPEGVDVEIRFRVIGDDRIAAGKFTDAIKKATEKIKQFLDSIGARYRFHESNKSDSAYFDVTRPKDKDTVNTRISDHTLPRQYDPPDLDVSAPFKREGAVSPDMAIKLLKDFLKDKIDLVDGAIIPAVSDYKAMGIPKIHTTERLANSSLLIHRQAVTLTNLSKLVSALNAEPLQQNAGQYRDALFSATVQDLIKDFDPSFMRQGERKNALRQPTLVRTYASTAEFRTPSSQYGLNNHVYTQKILFVDFVGLAKKQKIPIDEAILQALTDRDVHVTCSCPAFLFWGFKYKGTRDGYNYGFGETRAPKRNNVGLKNSTCKHLRRVLELLYYDNDVFDELVRRFTNLYKKIDQPWIMPKHAEDLEELGLADPWDSELAPKGGMEDF